MIGLEYIAIIRLLQFKKLASEVGVGSQTFQDWINQRRKIPKDRLVKLSRILNESEELISRELNENDKVEILGIEINRLKKGEMINVSTYTGRGKSLIGDNDVTADKIDCPSCGRKVELKEHVNKCECGARIKVLRERY